MPIWTTHTTPERLNQRSQGTMVEHIGIEYLEVGADYIKARMPVDARTRQPAGILHGGASAVLAETLGSVAGMLCVDRETKAVVGLEINANHVRPVQEGWVYGTARPLHLGNSTHIWDIRITNGDDKLVCIARLTLAVVHVDKIRKP